MFASTFTLKKKQYLNAGAVVRVLFTSKLLQQNELTQNVRLGFV